MAITKVVGNATFTFPDIWYVFGNQRVSVAGTSTKATITYGGITETRALNAGAAEFDLSPFIRMAFDPTDINGRTATGVSGTYKLKSAGSITLTLGDGSSTSTQAVPFMFAGMVAKPSHKPTEEWVVYAPNYAGDITILTDQPTSLEVSVDGGTAVAKSFALTGYGFRVDNTLWGSSDTDIQQVDVNYYGYSLINGTLTGDLVTPDCTLHIIFDWSDCDMVSLRWLDALGRTHYRILKDGQLTQTTESTGAYSLGAAVDYSGGWSKGDGNYRNEMKARKVQTLVLPAQRKELIPELMTLLASDFVDMYVGNSKWVRVDVVDASFTETHKHLQDFQVQISIPTENIPTR